MLGITENALKTALREIGSAHIYPIWLERWKVNPLWGNCQLVSEFTFRYLAPDGTQIYAIDGNTGKETEHWMLINKKVGDYIIDLTFDKDYDYSKAKFRLLQAERNLCKQLAALMNVAHKKRLILQNYKKAELDAILKGLRHST